MVNIVKEQNKIFVQTGWNFQAKGLPMDFTINHPTQRSRIVQIAYNPANCFIHSLNIY